MTARARVQRRLAIKLPLLALGGLSIARTASGAPMDQQALVIGNNDYQHGSKLINAVNDARLIDSTLRTLGVLSTLASNQTASQLAGTIEGFVKRLRASPSAIAWFFYSGHGASIEGRDLLLGTDAEFGTPDQLVRSGYPLAALRASLDQARPLAAIVVVDACRDNPFIATRGAERPAAGLSLREWAGTLTAYSTAPYTRALDWPDRPNGPYAQALSAALLDRRPRSIENIFMTVSDLVYERTDQRQKPGYYSELRRSILLADGRATLQLELPKARTPLFASSAVSRSVSPRAYRADLKLDDRYLGVRNDEWLDLITRIESAAASIDRIEAIHVITKARRHDTSDFDRSLAGLVLMEGRAVAKDRARAARVLETPALHGYIPAQTLLGELQYERQAYDQSFRWLTEASATGMPRPLLTLAQLSFEGRGTQQDPKKGLQLLKELMKATIGNGEAGLHP